jgi:TolB protein
LTDDFNDYFGLSVADKTTDKTTQIGTLVLDRATDLWITEADDKSGEARQITSNADNSYGISWGRTNRIVYGSVAGNNHDIWSISSDGQQRQQITFDPARDSYPTFSADGTRIFFISEREGVKSLWHTNQDGSQPNLMVRGASAQPFAASPDGKWIYFHSYFSGAAALWRVSTSGGEAEKIIDGTLENPAVAPDNKTVAAVWKDEEGKGKLAILNLENPAQQNWRMFDLIAGANPTAASSVTALRWTADGKAVAYVVQKKGVGNIWAQFLSGEAKQLTNFTTARVWSFDFSPDGKQIVCSRGDQQRFVTLIQLSKAD